MRGSTSEVRVEKLTEYLMNTLLVATGLVLCLTTCAAIVTVLILGISNG